MAKRHDTDTGFYGAQSDLLTPTILDRIQATGPMPSCTGFTDCGHAPTLSRTADIALIQSALTTLGHG